MLWQVNLILVYLGVAVSAMLGNGLQDLSAIGIIFSALKDAICMFRMNSFNYEKSWV